MELLQWVQAALWETVQFLVVGVGIGYLGKRWVGDQIVKLGRRWIAANERNTAIWLHYMAKANNAGHRHDNVLDCDQGHCKVFHTYAS